MLLEVDVLDKRRRRLFLGDRVFDLDTLSLTDAKGTPLLLREKSLRVLGALAERNGEVVKKDELTNAVWSGRAVSDDSLVQCIKDIRAILDDTERRVLRTAVGRGYSLHGASYTTSRSDRRPKVIISRLRADEHEPTLVEMANVITEELILALSPRAGFEVATSSEQLDEIDYVLEGRTSKSGQVVRIFMQAVKGRSCDVAFAETWETPIDAVEALPKHIGEKIASRLRVHLYNHAGAAFIDRSNDSLTTQQLMAKAAYRMSRIQMENRDAARDALSLAVEREPSNAVALAMRASTAVLLVLQQGVARIPDKRDFLMNLGNRAVGIAPQVDFVMLSRGTLRLWLDHDHAGARDDFARALQINPIFHLGLQFLGTSEILCGDHRAGIARIGKVIELGTTSNPRFPHYLTLVALGHLVGGAAEAAVAVSANALDLAPDDPWCGYVHAAAAADRPDIVETDEFQRIVHANDLPFSHFRDLPFADIAVVEMLESRLASVGYHRSTKPGGRIVADI
jgi:DNA-binding winged helix-turn-helix (wHTH) protein/tetratricopeptide (TPR) repeat protein